MMVKGKGSGIFADKGNGPMAREDDIRKAVDVIAKLGERAATDQDRRLEPEQIKAEAKEVFSALAMVAAGALVDLHRIANSLETIAKK